MDLWTTAEVARLAGVSARTLRHYDAIGLLAPASHGHGGLRRYGKAELLRLQQILLLKRLGLRLDTVAEILEGDLAPVEALRRHAAELDAERTRLDRLAATVDATIRQLEGGRPMAPETWFGGLDPATEAAYRDEARKRWGQAVVERSWNVLQELTPEERRAIPEAFNDINDRLNALRAAGRAPDDNDVQEVVVDHYWLIAKHWGDQPTAEAYKGLGALYTEEPRFKDTYDQVGEGFAEYMRAAMDAYAEANL
ncbi:MerR family transcriptional regulator [Glycomyces rhizosphaerae]|uniref:TipAS antibiotic-recognition domain-containing protein n=1 Tax=Glycomyces rhizosphaerae TaxID=2054422 RepID=A0ABV7Q4M5_9ACTN